MVERTTHVDVSPNGFTDYKEDLLKFTLESIDLLIPNGECMSDQNFNDLCNLINHNVATLKILRIKPFNIAREAEIISERFLQLEHLEISFPSGMKINDFLKFYSGGDTFFGSLIERSSFSLKQIKVEGYQRGKYSLFKEVQSEMQMLKKLEVSHIDQYWYSNTNNHAAGCLGLKNMLSKSPKLEVLKLSQSKLQDVSLLESSHRLLASVTLQNVTIDAVALKSLLTNVPVLQNLKFERCHLTQEINFSCQLPKLIRLEVIDSPGIVSSFVYGVPLLQVSYLGFTDSENLVDFSWDFSKNLIVQ